MGSQLATRRGLEARRLRIGISESWRAEALERYEREQARKEAKKAQKKGGLGGLIGTGGGAAIGALLAAPTGGLSVLAGAGVGAAIGGTVGSAIDPGSVNPGPAVSSALGNFVSFDERWGASSDCAIQRMAAPVQSTEQSLRALSRPAPRFPALPKLGGDKVGSPPLALPLKGRLETPFEDEVRNLGIRH